MSTNDPNSFSRPDLVAVTHFHLVLKVNFPRRILDGHVILDIEKRNQFASDSLFLDVRDLVIISVTDENDNSYLKCNIGQSVSFGSEFIIQLPDVPESADGRKRYKIRIRYQTSPVATGLQWLDPRQTTGGRHPYLLSQCQAIHARSVLPCQDTPSLKATYSAEIIAPMWATVLMSALQMGTQNIDNLSKLTKFHQPIPIPSYLLAIAVGDLVSKRIGPRSSVWSEIELIDASAHEFADTDTMLQIAEEICGPYVWGVYDLLVLPPSFAFGGMENPCITFLTPTLLAGDRSLANVVAHEISHSWSGNLVTNANFEHFWLNEGFTTFIEYKIKGRMFGEKYRHFHALMGLSHLRDDIKTLMMRGTPDLTKLVLNLRNTDPDDAFSSVPYKKGQTFLFYLETVLGGPKVFEEFLRSYFKVFKEKSIVTSDWKDYLYTYFSDKIQILNAIDWNSWMYKPGMPPVIPNYNTELLEACTKLAKIWISWNEREVSLFRESDIHNLNPSQRVQFLTELLISDKVLSITKLELMQALYDLDSIKNAEIKFLWIRLGLKSRWERKVKDALNFVSNIGRMKFVRPIYRDLYAWPEKRPIAIENFFRTKDRMMYVTAEMVKKDLRLNFT